MPSTMIWRTVVSFLLSLTCAIQASAQTGASASISTPPPTPSNPSATITGVPATTASEPDVYLHVPTLSVGRIELGQSFHRDKKRTQIDSLRPDVDNLQADINLNANVAQLVQINAGVQVGISKVNLTIADVDVELDLIVRLGNLVDIVNRVFESLDLNPLLINALNNVTSILDEVVGEVDGLLGSITQGGKTLSFVSDQVHSLSASGIR